MTTNEAAKELVSFLFEGAMLEEASNEGSDVNLELKSRLGTAFVTVSIKSLEILDKSGTGITEYNIPVYGNFKQ